MKKIGFNEHYGLQTAVFNGTKTKTRRTEKCLDQLYAAEKQLGKPLEIYQQEIIREGIVLRTNAGIISLHTRYKIDEEVAVAQAYKDLDYSLKGFATNPDRTCGIRREFAQKQAGWSNKMFVSAKFMPHQIRITNIKVERLQDITDEDCLKEGVRYDDRYWVMGYKVDNLWNKRDRQSYWYNARGAFAALIDKISGKGTWKRNPWVLVYSFKLIK